MIQLYQSKSPRHAVPPVNAKDTTRVGVWLKNNSYREGDTMAYLSFSNTIQLWPTNVRAIQIVIFHPTQFLLNRFDIL